MSDSDSEVMDEWADALAESGDSEASEEASGEQVQEEGEAAAPAPAPAPAGFDEIHDENKSQLGDDVNMDVILDIPVTIAMEIGRTKINIRNLLHLNQGSVVELDRMAGEPLDVLVNGTLIAHGEVVVVNEKFGIRLTDVISPSERVKKLK